LPLRFFEISLLLLAASLLVACSGGDGDRPSPRPRVPLPSTGTSSPDSSATYGTTGTPPSVPSPQSSSNPSVPACTPEEITRTASDGFVHGYFVRPAADSAARLPAVIAIHGGVAVNPESGDRQARLAAVEYASHLCAEGFAVFAVDYRWSIIGHEEMLDVDAAYDYLVARPDIDRSRIAVMGGSNGGYMATMAVIAPAFRRPFAAAVDLYGFVDVGAEVRREPNNTQSILTLQQLGDPRQNRAAYASISPIKLIKGKTAPLLIVVGSEDGLVPELTRFRDLLKAAGTQMQYFEVEGATHYFEVRPPQFAAQLWARVIAFLHQQLG